MLMIIVAVVITIITTGIHAQQVCQLTEPDILGPYYIPDAPRSEVQLCANLPANDRLELTGQVVDYDSKCTRGIPNVKLDLWQVIK
jgi:protocatechuate 3,4-dioxygenase beta subunit